MGPAVTEPSRSQHLQSVALFLRSPADRPLNQEKLSTVLCTPPMEARADLPPVIPSTDCSVTSGTSTVTVARLKGVNGRSVGEGSNVLLLSKDSLQSLIRPNASSAERIFVRTDGSANSSLRGTSVLRSQVMTPRVEGTSLLRPLSANSSVLAGQSLLSPQGVATCSKHDLEACSQQAVQRSTRQLKRLEALLKRLRRLQCKQSSAQAKQQLGDFVEKQRRHFATLSRTMRPATLESEDLAPDACELRNMQQLSTQELVKLVHTVQEQRVASASSSQWGMEPAVAREVAPATGRIRHCLKHVRSQADPDLTESSGDEAVGHQSPAEVTWLRRRAVLGSRWSWLQAQVSDLEYRIRQHTDCYRKRRLAKGSVQLQERGDPEETSAARCRPLLKPLPRRQLYSLHRAQSSRPSAVIRCCCYPPEALGPCSLCAGRLNASHTLLTNLAVPQKLGERLALLDHSYHCKLSDRAEAYPGLQQEAQLRQTGAPRLAPAEEGLVLQEEVLSRKKLKKKRRLELISRLDSRELSKRQLKKQRRQRKLLMKQRARQQKRLNALQLSEESDSEKRHSRPAVHQAQAKAGVTSYPPPIKLKIKKRRLTELQVCESSEWSRLSDSSASPAEHNTPQPSVRRKQNSQYDINNVVIPSLAASSRIEVLQYKEIQTPRWRDTAFFSALTEIGDEQAAEFVQQNGKLVIRQSTEDEQVEDVSDSQFAARHRAGELLERKRVGREKQEVGQADLDTEGYPRRRFPLSDAELYALQREQQQIDAEVERSAVPKPVACDVERNEEG